MSKRFEVACQNEKQQSDIKKKLHSIKGYENSANGSIILRALDLYLRCTELEVVQIKEAKVLKEVMFK